MSKINEIATAAGGAFQVGAGARVFPNKNGTKRNKNGDRVNTKPIHKKGKDKTIANNYKDGFLSESKMSFEEEVLRESIRRIIHRSKMNFYEDKGRQWLHEQNLRGVIKSLLSEASDGPHYNTTGANSADECYKRIRQTISTGYSSLATSLVQRESYVYTMITLLRDNVQQSDSMKQIEMQAAAKVQGGNAGTPTLPSAQEDAGVAAERSKQRALQLVKQLAPPANVDQTGAQGAVMVLRTIVPQIIAARDGLFEERDVAVFDAAILGDVDTNNLIALCKTTELTMRATGKAGDTTVPADGGIISRLLAGDGGAPPEAAPAAPAAPPVTSAALSAPAEAPVAPEEQAPVPGKAPPEKPEAGPLKL